MQDQSLINSVTIVTIAKNARVALLNEPVEKLVRHTQMLFLLFIAAKTMDNV